MSEQIYDYETSLDRWQDRNPMPEAVTRKCIDWFEKGLSPGAITPINLGYWKPGTLVMFSRDIKGRWEYRYLGPGPK